MQTLSRLNCTHPGKGKTFVLNFQNTSDEALKPDLEATAIEKLSDPKPSL